MIDRSGSLLFMISIHLIESISQPSPCWLWNLNTKIHEWSKIWPSTNLDQAILWSKSDLHHYVDHWSFLLPMMPFSVHPDPASVFHSDMTCWIESPLMTIGSLPEYLLYRWWSHLSVLTPCLSIAYDGSEWHTEHLEHLLIHIFT